MSGVVEEKEKKRLREELSRDSEQTAYNNFTDRALQDHASKKKKQVERKQWLQSRARKPRVGSEFQVNIAHLPDLQPKLPKGNEQRYCWVEAKVRSDVYGISA